jgi:hypothetical protein
MSTTHVGWRRSKTLATWITFLGGSVGLHRFYLHGLRDPWGWLYVWPTLVGVYGVLRIRELGLDDQLSWMLIPVLGLMLSGTMLRAILYGLMTDEQWQARFPAEAPHPSGLLNVFGMLLAMFVGSIVLISTIAFGTQCYFQFQMESQAATPESSLRAPG